MQVCQINTVSNMQKMLSQLNTKLNTVKYKVADDGVSWTPSQYKEISVT